MSRRVRRDDGSSDALGLALLTPAAIGLAVAIVFLGRGVDSRATVQSAAESAAQAAAQERSGVAAVAAAEEVGRAMLVDPSSCSAPQVSVDLSDFRPGGQVAVTVSCTVSTGGLELIDPPTTGPTTATAFAAIDPLRATEAAP
ncbi:MAG: ATP/GTP-binding protein [Acidobacteriota bacterium]